MGTTFSKKKLSIKDSGKSGKVQIEGQRIAKRGSDASRKASLKSSTVAPPTGGEIIPLEDAIAATPQQQQQQKADDIPVADVDLSAKPVTEDAVAPVVDTDTAATPELEEEVSPAPQATPTKVGGPPAVPTSPLPAEELALANADNNTDAENTSEPEQTEQPTAEEEVKVSEEVKGETDDSAPEGEDKNDEATHKKEKKSLTRKVK